MGTVRANWPNGLSILLLTGSNRGGSPHSNAHPEHPYVNQIVAREYARPRNDMIETDVPQANSLPLEVVFSMLR